MKKIRKYNLKLCKKFVTKTIHSVSNKFTFYTNIKLKSSNISFNPKFFYSERNFEKKQLIQKNRFSYSKNPHMSQKSLAIRIQNNNKELKQPFTILAEKSRSP